MRDHAGQGSTVDRLRASAARLAVLKEERAAETERRDALIVQARDEGYPWDAIARAAGRAPSRCVAIVAGTGATEPG
jgi:hypothetical protein